MKLAITGHRPQKLNGFTDIFTDPYYIFLGNMIRGFLIQHKVSDIYVGGALGMDTIAALVALKLRDKGFPIAVHLVLPCPPEIHSSRWTRTQKDIYFSILNRVDSTEIVSLTYTPSCMQQRNMRMVDLGTHLLSCWDGSSGGTGNCIKYARTKYPSSHFFNIAPSLIKDNTQS